MVEQFCAFYRGNGTRHFTLGLGTVADYHYFVEAAGLRGSELHIKGAAAVKGYFLRRVADKGKHQRRARGHGNRVLPLGIGSRADGSVFYHHVHAGQRLPVLIDHAAGNWRTGLGGSLLPKRCVCTQLAGGA